MEQCAFVSRRAILNLSNTGGEFVFVSKQNSKVHKRCAFKTSRLGQWNNYVSNGVPPSSMFKNLTIVMRYFLGLPRICISTAHFAWQTWLNTIDQRKCAKCLFTTPVPASYLLYLQMGVNHWQSMTHSFGVFEFRSLQGNVPFESLDSIDIKLSLEFLLFLLIENAKLNSRCVEARATVERQKWMLVWSELKQLTGTQFISKRSLVNWEKICIYKRPNSNNSSK